MQCEERSIDTFVTGTKELALEMAIKFSSQSDSKSDVVNTAKVFEDYLMS